MTQHGLSLAERMALHVDTSGGPDACHPYRTLEGNTGGYRTVTVAGRTRRAHAVALELALGRSLKPGHLAAHHCDFPSCCNPRHLWEATQKENMQDAVEKGRYRGCHALAPTGARRVKQKEEQPMDGLDPLSRWRYTLDRTYYLLREVAADLGVSPHAIRGRCSTIPGLAPAQIGRYAGRDVWLFTPDEFEALRVEFEARPARVGRPQVWSEQEKRDRQRRRVQQHYWTTIAELATYQGRAARAERAERRAAEISHELRAQRPKPLLARS